MKQFDFKTLKKDVLKASKQAFLEIAKKHKKETICAFALYSDESAMTICPAINTKSHLEKTQKKNPKYPLDFKFAPAEWAFESQGADDLFNDICERLSDYLDTINDDVAFNKFRAYVYGTCIEVLEELKHSGFFEEHLGTPVLLLFAVSDSDMDIKYHTKMIKALNDDKIHTSEYIKWIKMFN